MLNYQGIIHALTANIDTALMLICYSRLLLPILIGCVYLQRSVSGKLTFTSFALFLLVSGLGALFKAQHQTDLYMLMLGVNVVFSWLAVLGVSLDLYTFSHSAARRAKVRRDIEKWHQYLSELDS